MKLSVAEALQQAISHHQVNQFQDAERLYRAILHVHPGHADANHNLGVLAISLGKPQAALPFLQKAIEANPEVVQFWITLATAQLDCKQVATARQTLATARQRGIGGDAIDSLEKRLLNMRSAEESDSSPDLLEPSQNQINTLLNFYYSGQISRVEQACQDLLAQFPSSVIVMNIWGVALLEQNKFHEAVGVYTQAIKLKPDYAEAYNNRGNSFNGLGRNQEALDDYNKAIQFKPDFVEAYNNRGNSFNGLGRNQEALDDLNKAIQLKPDYAEAYNNRGNSFNSFGRHEEALDDLNKAIQLKPDFAEAYNNRGYSFNVLGRHKEALDDYNKAIQLKPDYAEAYNNRGNVFNELGRHKEALNDYNKAIQLKPDYAEAYNNRGNSLNEFGRHEEALDDLSKSIRLKPDYADAYNNRGNSFNEFSRHEEALDDLNKSIQLKPDYAEAYNNRGNVFKELGRHQEALDDHNKAIQLKSDFVQAYWNSSLVRLLNGELRLGFELYEWRQYKKKDRTRPPRARFLWDGKQSLDGKHFVVYDEQGLGDMIQFCRYLPLLEDKGARVSFKVRSQLHSLIGTIESQVELISEMPEEDAIDFESPLMSLPYLLETELNSIPASNPYLFASESKTKFWHKRLNQNTFKVGICWQGSKTKVDVGRSFPLALFEIISKIPNVELISLQKGEGEEQIENIPFNLKTLGSEFDAGSDAFVDTAAVMKNCELIITSDTAVAHLAGALGCLTWVILKQVPDWRWLLDRTDSPWYPTMSLYRQKARGDWMGVFEKIEHDLKTIMEQKRIVK